MQIFNAHQCPTNHVARREEGISETCSVGGLVQELVDDSGAIHLVQLQAEAVYVVLDLPGLEGLGAGAVQEKVDGCEEENDGGVENSRDEL